MNIELDNVSKNFKNQTVLENVNLKLESGKIYGLVGRNGSGKSVLLKIMTGLMEPSDGIIKYGGIPLKKGQYAKDVGIVLDCIGFMPEYTAVQPFFMESSMRSISIPYKSFASVERASKRSSENNSFGMR